MHAPTRNLLAEPAPQRSRSRRERRSDAARKPVLHVVMPGQEVARAEPRPRETIAAFLRRTGWALRDRKLGWQFRKGLPTYVEVNGEAVLRRSWSSTKIGANDNVRFVSHPLGGQGSTGKQVLGLVALVAVSAFALWLPVAIGLASGSFAALATTAAVTIGGALLINSLTAPKAGATNSPTSTQDQIYSVAASGNTAKLGQPLPVWYGRLKTFPDFAATPWGEFVGNDQYLNLLLSTGMGTFAYEALYVDDTLLWTASGGLQPSFAGVQLAFYGPGEPVTLFPVAVSASSEVNGQQLPDGAGTYGGTYQPASGQVPGEWVGGYVSNPAGTSVQALAIDFVMPAGCYTVNTNSNDANANNIGAANIGIQVEICPVNDAGAPIGDYATLFQVVRSYNSTSPIRDSIKMDVGAGRYLVRMRRLDAGLPSQQGSNAVVWAGLRAFLSGSNAFPDVSTVAIRIKATQATQGSYKFGVLATRQVQVWTGSNFVTQASRNPGWAFLDAVTNAQYGTGLSLAKVDFNAIVNFAASCDSRGDTFDYCFTAATAVPEALDKILTPARARHFWLGDTVSVVRDEWRDVPSMLLTDREIVRDSTQVTFTMLGDEDPDAVIVEYIDEETWGPAQVQYPPDTQFFTATRAEVKRLDGIVNREQAYRECAFYYLQSIYRRENVQIGTEYEGRAITFGSVLRIQSELPMAYGFGGAVVNRSGSTLTLNPAPIWEDGPFYVRLRRSDGKWFGPVSVTQGTSASLAVLNAADLAAAQAAQGVTLDAVLEREDGGEDPSFEFGSSDSQSKLCVVLSGTPNGNTCTLNMVVDDIRVHTTDLGSPPSLPSSQFPSNDNLPLIVGLNALFGQGTAEPRLSASWFPAPGALYYIADVSYDGGNSWQQVYEGQDNQFTAIVTLAALTLRVQALTASISGPYASLDLAAPTIVVADQTVALSSVVAGIRDQITKEYNAIVTQLKDQLADLEAHVAALWSRSDINKQEVRNQLFLSAGGVKAAVEDVRTVAISTQEAFAAYQITVSAQFGDITASVDETTRAIATIDGYAAAARTLKLDVNGYIVGTALFNGGIGSSSFVVTADTFLVAAPGVSGGDPVPFFSVGNVGGLARVGINGNVLINGSVDVTKMNVGTLTAISAHFGNATVDGTLSGSTGGLVLSFTGDRIEVNAP